MVTETQVELPDTRLPRLRTMGRRPLPLWGQVLLLFLSVAVIYWGTATQSNTFDAVAYANQIVLAARTGTMRGLFHPHHLLFNALGFVFWRLVQAGGYHGGPLVVLQRINATVAAAGIALFFSTLRQYVPLRSAWLGALLLAASFGWWICATDGRVNTISAVLLLAAFAFLGDLQRAPTWKQAVASGALSGAAVLFHESAGLFGIIGLTGLVLAAPRASCWRLALSYLGAWATTIIVPYAVVSREFLHLHSFSAFHHWAAAYAESGQWWDFHLWRDLRQDGYALRHAVFADPPRFAPLRLLYAGALVGWLAALGGLIVALPRLLRGAYRRIVLVCLLWIGVYGLFFTVWCPGYFVFWTPVLVPLVVLLALTLTHRRVWRFAGTWVALCMIVNLTCSIAPHLRPAREIWDRVTMDAREHTSSRDLLIVPGAGPDGPSEVFIPYFADRACLSIHETLNQAQGKVADAPTAMQARVTRALLAGRHVYVYGEAWDDPITVRDLERHHPGLTDTGIFALFSAFRQIPAWTSPRGPVYRLRLAHPPVKKFAGTTRSKFSGAGGR